MSHLAGARGRRWRRSRRTHPETAGGAGTARRLTRRLSVALLTLLGASAITFGLVHLAPLEPVRYITQFRQVAREEQIRALRAWYGLDEPVPVQYVRWLGRVAQGDFGRSVTTGRPVGPDVAQRIPWTLLLVGTSMALAWVLAVPLALACARGGPAGLLADAAVTAGMLVPVLLVCSLLVHVFAVRLSWIPILPPYELRPLDPHLWRSLLMPGVGLALPTAALMAGILRPWVRAGLRAPYANAARARGLSERRVLRRHAARVATAALIAHPLPVLGAAFGTALVVEEIFGWPGMGRALMRAAGQRDITSVQALVFLLSALVVGAEFAITAVAGRTPCADGAAVDPWWSALEGAAAVDPRPPERPAPLPARGLTLWAPLAIVGTVVAAVIAGPLLAPFPPDQVSLDEILQPPAVRHWMGTDASGRDLFSRLLYAGRLTLGLALAPAAGAVAAAVLLGVLAQWSHKGWGDVAAGTVRALVSVPVLALAVAVVAVAGRTPAALAAVFTAYGLAQVAGSVRALIAGAAGWPFVQAGLAAGASPVRVGERHLAPHLARPLLAEALGLVPGFLLLEAALGFFGYSLSPTTPTWGNMLFRGRDALHRGDWWLLVFPVGFVVVASWGFGRLADAMREPAPPTFLRMPRPARRGEWSRAHSWAGLAGQRHGVGSRTLAVVPPLGRIRPVRGGPHPAADPSPADGGATGGSSG